MNHIAKCHCGGVEVVCTGEPDPVVVCHCELCQRRTGSFFHVAAWFDENKVNISGDTKGFTRTTGNSGRPFTFHFCTNCGTSIWWRSSNPDGPLKDKIGIAGGCFAEKDFPKPTLSIFEKRKHDWVNLPTEVDHFDEGL